MSSKPSKEGVTRVLEILQQLEKTERALFVAESQYTELSISIPRMQAEGQVLRQRLVRDLDNMDVAQRGNLGWEWRFAWFLRELAHQVYDNTLVFEEPAPGLIPEDRKP